jgi:hypothetical protein
MTGAQFEIRIDGTPRTYRDRKDFAMEAASFLKSQNPHSPGYANGQRAERPQQRSPYSSPGRVAQADHG